jgi:hypothetical protein
MKHLTAIALFWIVVAHAAVAQVSSHADLMHGEEVWVRTMTPEFDPDNREETYKVYSHLMAFDGETLLTKGAGGKYPHHRGLFIGWKATAAGSKAWNTWSMNDAVQAAVRPIHMRGAAVPAMHGYVIDWKTDAGEVLVEEQRILRLAPGPEGIRQVDFISTLNAKDAPVQLRGDLQHAGMQVRLANEVSEHQETTDYILPEGAKELEDDKVVGAWWVCVSAEIAGKRYWVMHMTPPNNPTGEPVYSIRRYARFGAFFEPDLKPGSPLKLHFRVAWSETPLDRDACQALYAAYAEGMKG